MGFHVTFRECTSWELDWPECDVQVPAPNVRTIAIYAMKGNIHYRGYMGVILGLSWDNGKENGNYYNGIYWGYIGSWQFQASMTTCPAADSARS